MTKAFDSVQIQAVLTSLQELGTEDVFIELLKDIYINSSMTVHLHKERIYPVAVNNVGNMFTATVENIFLRLTWKNQRIDGEYLSHLCFDDILICA